jgi:signal peptidase I
MLDMHTRFSRLRRVTLFFDVLKVVVLAVIIVGLIRFFVAEPFIVSGDSMVPTFNPNDYLILDELTYELHQPQRGDIVVFHYPLDPSIYFIKRLIGIPGDTVVVNNGSVYVLSGKTERRLTEPYVNVATPKDEVGTTTLGTDEYFVLGDNRNSSFDSRVWGPVPRRYISGRVLMRLYPFGSSAVFKAETGATSTPVSTSTIHSHIEK